MLILGSYALGKHALFYRDGDLITVPAANTGSIAGASSRTNKPDPTDPLYVDLGAIDDWSDDIKSAGDVKVYKPSPGRRQLYAVVEKGADATCKFTTQEVNALAVEIFYRTSQKLTQAGGQQQFNPLSAPARTGWFHTELYDQNTNAIAMSLDVYGLMRITGGMAGKEGDILKPTWELTVLYSTLNTGLAQ